MGKIKSIQCQKYLCANLVLIFSLIKTQRANIFENAEDRFFMRVFFKSKMCVARECGIDE